MVCLASSPLRLHEIRPTLEALGQNVSSSVGGARPVHIVLTLPTLFRNIESYGVLPTWLTDDFPSLHVQRVAIDLGPIEKLHGCLEASHFLRLSPCVARPKPCSRHLAKPRKSRAMNSEAAAVAACSPC